MINCPRCDSSFEEKSGKYIKKYCCRACANVRVWTVENNNTRSKKLQEYFSSMPPEELSQKRKNAALKSAPKISATRMAQLMNADFSTLGYTSIRKRILIEQDYKCNRCSLTRWLDEDISLELEHKDGNKKNNGRSNLECLCPNCHALTPTWRGKDRTKGLYSSAAAAPS